MPWNVIHQKPFKKFQKAFCVETYIKETKSDTI